MESFGQALKRLRTSKRKTLREVGSHTGKSISYLSDIEHDRKHPPKLETVHKIESFLGGEIGYLVNLALMARSTAKQSIAQRAKMNREFSTVLLRADELPANKKEVALKKFLETLDELAEDS